MEYGKIKIPVRFVIELGIMRKHDECAKCGRRIDIPNYNIQLCSKCRMVELDKYVDDMGIKK